VRETRVGIAVAGSREDQVYPIAIIHFTGGIGADVVTLDGADEVGTQPVDALAFGGMRHGVLAGAPLIVHGHPRERDLEASVLERGAVDLIHVALKWEDALAGTHRQILRGFGQVETVVERDRCRAVRLDGEDDIFDASLDVTAKRLAG
jgi:hypothetical protein